MGEGLGSKIKRAFKWHWNLLVVGAGVVAGLLSNRLDVVLPAVAAGELLYLGTLGLNDRFQAVLRGRKLKPNEERQAQEAAAKYQRLVSFLSQRDGQRFDLLRQRCARLLQLRRQMDAEERAFEKDSFEGESLDQMLWLYLKLLHQKSGLERFLTGTKRKEIEAELELAESQLAEAEQRDKSSGMESRLTATNRDRVATIKERLANHDKAMENLELATAEIDKTEQQITHLCEVGMTTRDSGGLGAQIDSISESLRVSERAFSAPGMEPIPEDEVTPPLLSGAVPPPMPRVAE